MAKIIDALTPELTRFVREQPVFFVATAPLDATGHVNCSPKGLDTFRILAPDRVAYLDLTGSGNETAAHIHENGRVTFMFCSFGKAPRILRIYGRARVVTPGSAEWPELAGYFPSVPGIRQIIAADVEFVQTSCGFAVPRMEVVEERDTLLRWAQSKGEEELRAYRAEKNARSLDGLQAPDVVDGAGGDRPSA